MLNAAPARQLDDDLAAVTDILVVNEIEAEMMTGLDSVEGFAAAEAAAARLLHRVPCVIVTLGATGLVLATRGADPQLVSGHPVAVVSTHGAGDALIGALAAQIALGADVPTAARYANAAAAALVATPEADRSRLSTDETLVLLNESAS